MYYGKLIEIFIELDHSDKVGTKKCIKNIALKEGDSPSSKKRSS